MLVREAYVSSVERKFPSLKSLELWAQSESWEEFRAYRYFEYLFPMHLPTCFYGDTFCVTPEVVASLKSDSMYMAAYEK